jgi:hypothetical protein
MWTELGLAQPFEGHDHHITVGHGVGEDGCAIPTCGIDWIRTLPPVELAEWALHCGPRDALHQRGELARSLRADRI